MNLDILPSDREIARNREINCRPEFTSSGSVTKANGQKKICCSVANAKVRQINETLPNKQINRVRSARQMNLVTKNAQYAIPMNFNAF